MQKQQPRAPRVRVVDMPIDGIGQHFVEKATAPVDRHLGLYFAAMMVTHLLGVCSGKRVFQAVMRHLEPSSVGASVMPMVRLEQIRA